MTGKTARAAHEYLWPTGPAPFTTLVELTFQKKKVERWIRFGHKSFEQIIDRRRSLIGFAPESIFAFVRWASNDYGTIVSRLDILRAVGREPHGSRRRVDQLKPAPARGDPPCVRPVVHPHAAGGVDAACVARMPLGLVRFCSAVWLALQLH